MEGPALSGSPAMKPGVLSTGPSSVRGHFEGVEGAGGLGAASTLETFEAAPRLRSAVDRGRLSHLRTWQLTVRLKRVNTREFSGVGLHSK